MGDPEPGHPRDSIAPRGRLFRAASARALEDALLARLGEDRDRVRADPSRLARPLRIVVPSGALRAHLAARLARAGEAWVGVVVQTLERLVREVLERAGTPAAADDLFPIHVRRHARREPVLRDALDDLSDGYGVVRAALDDLLDAGFGPEHADALDDALAEQGIGVASAERALLRVAARVAAAVAAGALWHRSRGHVLAREAIERDPARALPSRGVAVYGFSDATGVQADLLCALLRGADASAWLTLPAAPTPLADAGAGEPVFGAAFRERLRGVCDGPEPIAGATVAPQVEIWQARDPFEEARAVADALRRRLDAGAVPERLAVVARDLEPYRLALRRHLSALGVPFSGVREPGPLAASGRRLGALLALLREGDGVPAERWLDALERAAGRTLSLEQRSDWLHALNARGCSALRDVFALREAAVRLDVPRALAAAADGRRGVLRREVGAQQVAQLARAADATGRQLAAWPAHAPLAEHAARLRALVDEALGWDAAARARAELEPVLASAARPDAFERAEFLEWLARALEWAGRVPLGGDGGGVQLLSVMEARALDFDAIYALGLCRGSFPRPVREDSLLPDRLRRRLRDLLPDLPVKREGFDEERFLFAQLLTAAPALTLSFPSFDAEGKPLAPSPLLDALLRGARAVAIATAPAPRHATPRERAAELGLRASREVFGSALGVALASAGAGAACGIAAPELVRARLAALAELDPRDARRGQAGPLLGFAGRIAADDARIGAIHVSWLEDLARCPWQSFLKRVLGLKPPRDARGALPRGGDARLLGNVVHAALAAIAGRSERDLEALRAEASKPLAWPEPDALDALLLEAAREVVASESIALTPYAEALARRARLYVEQARRADWRAQPPHVLGGEVDGVLALPGADGGVREIRFRADRVDREGGALCLTDYKTGRPPAGDSPDPQRHAQASLEGLVRGGLLQTSVYALAGGEAAHGRYLFLRPDLKTARAAYRRRRGASWSRGCAACSPPCSAPGTRARSRRGCAKRRRTASRSPAPAAS